MKDGYHLPENYRTSWGSLSKGLHKGVYIYVHRFEDLALKQLAPLLIVRVSFISA